MSELESVRIASNCLRGHCSLELQPSVELSWRPVEPPSIEHWSPPPIGAGLEHDRPRMITPGRLTFSQRTSQGTRMVHSDQLPGAIVPFIKQNKLLQ